MRGIEYMLPVDGQDEEMEDTDETTTLMESAEMTRSLSPAAIVTPLITKTTLTTSSDAVRLDLWIQCQPEWIKEFKLQSPSQRAVMLSQLLDAFNDGVEGINISFSEPK